MHDLTTEPRPEGHVPPLPEDVTTLSDDELMDQFRLQIAWQNFFSSQVAEAEIAEEEAEGELKVLEAHHLLTGDKLYKSRAERDTDPEVLRAREAHTEARARRKALSVASESRERSANFLSRELSRRIGRDPVVRRNDRWGA